MKIVIAQKDRVLSEREYSDNEDVSFPNGLTQKDVAISSGLDFETISFEISDMLDDLLEKDIQLAGPITISIEDAMIPNACAECGQRDESTIKQKICDFCVEK